MRYLDQKLAGYEILRPALMGPQPLSNLCYVKIAVKFSILLIIKISQEDEILPESS